MSGKKTGSAAAAAAAAAASEAPVPSVQRGGSPHPRALSSRKTPAKRRRATPAAPDSPAASQRTVAAGRPLPADDLQGDSTDKRGSGSSGAAAASPPRRRRDSPRPARGRSQQKPDPKKPGPKCQKNIKTIEPVLHIIYAAELAPYEPTEEEIDAKVAEIEERTGRQCRRSNAVYELTEGREVRDVAAGGTADCCELCSYPFRDRLEMKAKEADITVHKHPIRSIEDFVKFGEAVENGEIVRGAAAVFLHSSICKNMNKECIPFWEFYPVLETIAEKNLLLYPAVPAMDKLHSEKRYRSKCFPPTHFIEATCERRGNVWEVLGGKREIASGLAAVKEQSMVEGLETEEIMVKMGCTWGGRAVWRAVANAEDVFNILNEKLFPQLPYELQTVPILLQARVPIVAELRFVVSEGEVMTWGWEGLRSPELGKCARQDEVLWGDDWLGKQGTWAALAKAGLATDAVQRRALEEKVRPTVDTVLAEARKDNGGVLPQYMRVDFLVCEEDKRPERKANLARGVSSTGQRRGWFLGERESWGADLVGNPSEKRDMEALLVHRMVRLTCERANWPFKLDAPRRLPAMNSPLRRRVSDEVAGPVSSAAKRQRQGSGARAPSTPQRSARKPLPVPPDSLKRKTER